jgi:hypothetical protein
LESPTGEVLLGYRQLLKCCAAVQNFWLDQFQKQICANFSDDVLSVLSALGDAALCLAPLSPVWHFIYGFRTASHNEVPNLRVKPVSCI